LTTKLPTEEAETPLIVKWGPMKPQSLDEEARATPQKRKRKRKRKRPLSDEQREHLLSEKHIAHLREMNRKRAEAGKRVTPHIGSVHGWGGSKRKELVRIRAEVSRKADIIMKRLADEGVVEETLAAVVADDGTVNDLAAANAALRFSVEIMLGGDNYPLNAKQPHPWSCNTRNRSLSRSPP
jgi:hypothetical protein